MPKYICAVDWGQPGQDYAALAVFNVEQKRLVEIERFYAASYQHHRDRIQHMHDKWRFEVIWIESSGLGNVNIEALQSGGLPVRSYVMTAKRKHNMLAALRSAIASGGIVLPDDIALTSELEAVIGLGLIGVIHALNPVEFI